MFNAIELEIIMLTDDDELEESKRSFKRKVLEPTLNLHGVYPAPDDGEPIYPLYQPV